MKGFKRIISFFMAFAMVCTIFVLPVKADYSTSTTDTLWGSYIRAGVNSVHDVPIIGTLLGYVVGASSGRVCAASDDQLHHADSYESCAVDKDGTPYVSCICKYCGDRFKAVASDLSAAYDDYVETLPAPSYTSDGSILWSPEISYAYIFTNNDRWYCPHYSGTEGSSSTLCTFSFDCANKTLVLRPLAGKDSFYQPYLQLYFSGPYPIDGYYKRLKQVSCNCSYVSNSTSKLSSYFYDAESNATLHYAGVSYGFDLRASYSWTAGCQYASYSYYSPVYEVTPFNPSGVGDTYNINTRPTSITGGNYGIVGDNGQITKVEDNSTIVNETNNTFYNPATGQTVPITGWSYDYSDRSYKVTLESGDTVTVTYGDENITIQEGDTVYNVYYLIDGSGSEIPVDPPAACEHDWQEASSTDPTCILPGKVTLSCTKCQQTKTETIPALGHNWQVKQTVTTQYDEEGNLTQQGYTIFECSRCHEQYKSTDGTIPPGGGSGTDPGGEEGETTIGDLIEKLLSGVGSIVGGIIKGLLSLLTKAVEALAGLAELFTTFVGSLVELWGGFTSFLSAVFPFLPEEFVIIIELGLILMIAAAVFRKFIS